MNLGLLLALCIDAFDEAWRAARAASTTVQLSPVQRLESRVEELERAQAAATRPAPPVVDKKGCCC